MSTRNVHVTGGKGFIGRGIVAGLRRNPLYHVTYSDVDDVNVLDRSSLEACFAREQPDTVIHLAGLMGAQGSKKDLYEYFAVNSVGVLNALDAASRAAVGTFVFMSSLTVHGQSDGVTPATEQTPLRPQHVYASSKAASEYYVRDYARFRQMNAVILRPTIIPGNLDGEPNAINEFCSNILADEPIVIFGQGTHRREWLSLADLVRAVEKAVAFTAGKRGVSEDFIISSGNGISMMDLARTCVRVLGKGRVETVDKKTSQAFSLTSDISKAHQILGWQPEDRLEAMIEDVARSIQARRS